MALSKVLLRKVLDEELLSINLTGTAALSSDLLSKKNANFPPALCPSSSGFVSERWGNFAKGKVVMMDEEKRLMQLTIYLKAALDLSVFFYF